MLTPNEVIGTSATAAAQAAKEKNNQICFKETVVVDHLIKLQPPLDCRQQTSEDFDGTQRISSPVRRAIELNTKNIQKVHNMMDSKEETQSTGRIDHLGQDHLDPDHQSSEMVSQNQTIQDTNS